MISLQTNTDHNLHVILEEIESKLSICDSEESKFRMRNFDDQKNRLVTRISDNLNLMSKVSQEKLIAAKVMKGELTLSDDETVEYSSRYYFAKLGDRKRIHAL